MQIPVVDMNYMSFVAEPPAAVNLTEEGPHWFYNDERTLLVCGSTTASNTIPAGETDPMVVFTVEARGGVECSDDAKHPLVMKMVVNEGLGTSYFAGPFKNGIHGDSEGKVWFDYVGVEPDPFTGFALALRMMPVAPFSPNV
jgi:hypothetical protein